MAFNTPYLKYGSLELRMQPMFHALGEVRPCFEGLCDSCWL